MFSSVVCLLIIVYFVPDMADMLLRDIFCFLNYLRFVTRRIVVLFDAKSTLNTLYIVYV